MASVKELCTLLLQNEVEIDRYMANFVKDSEFLTKLYASNDKEL